MNIALNGSPLVLHRLQRLGLVDAAGTVAKVVSGRLWITLENDRRDIFLAAGDSWTIDRDGLTLVQAEERATLVLTDARKRRAAWRSRIAKSIARWFTRSSRAVVPYY